MENSDDVLWLRVARIVSGFITTALGALFLLELGVIFGAESVSAWTSFAMFIGTMLWFITVTIPIWEGTANGRLHKNPDAFLMLEVFFVAFFLASFLGHFYEILKMPAMIFGTLIAGVFLVISLHISLEILDSKRKYRRAK